MTRQFTKQLVCEKTAQVTNQWTIALPLDVDVVLVKFRDKRAALEQFSFIYLDRAASRFGSLFPWNSYQHCVEEVKVSLTDKGLYVLILPLQLTIDQVYS